MEISDVYKIALCLNSFLLALISAITDIKQSVVKNKIVLASLCLALPILIIYYAFYQRELLLNYFINVLIISIISWLLYYLKIWGGGDSKLLIVISLCIPVELYFESNGSFRLLELPVFIFSFGYLYLLLESIIIGVKTKRKFSFPTKKSIFVFLKEYVFLSVYMILVSEVFRYFFLEAYYENVLLFWVISCLLSIMLKKASIFNNLYVFLISLLFAILLKVRNYSFNFVPYIIIFVLFILKNYMSIYNYRTLDINEIKEGDILSVGSILLLQDSNIKGLPSNISEDFSAKLSLINIEAIHKWQKNNPNIKTLTIVAKIPFAIFIFLGYIYFVILEALK